MMLTVHLKTRFIAFLISDAAFY